MIRVLSVTALILAATPAMAEIATVRGGEHADFTRLVVDAGQHAPWTLEDAGGGYTLHMEPPVSGYNLSLAFNRIGRDRVTRLSEDRATGRLRITLGCECHVTAFEFRPGMVVMDVFDGAPENAEDTARGDRARELFGGLPVGTAATNYDWLRDWPRPHHDTATAAGPPIAHDFGPLRDAILAQISRGVDAGVIELASDMRLPPPGKSPERDTGRVRILLEDTPHAALTTPPGTVHPNARQCPSDDDIMPGLWDGTPSSPDDTDFLRIGLVGEFDAAQPEMVMRSARRQIGFGFGREARETLALLAAADRKEANLLVALSHVVDLESPETDRDGTFAEFADCDGAAALWAMLEAMIAGRNPAPDTNRQAAILAFSRLPGPLRQHLGPFLAISLIEADDPATARAIRNATLRGADAQDPALLLMDARLEMAAGAPDKARALADKVLLDSSMPDGARATAAALVAEASFRGHRPPPDELPTLIAGYLMEARDPASERALRRAQALTLALTGDHDRALAVPASVETRADLWRIMANDADDDTFLRHAIVPAKEIMNTALDEETLALIARRLLDLGFPAQAHGWLGAPGPVATDETRLLAGKIALASRDAHGAIHAVDSVSGPAAAEIRGHALIQLGNPQEAAHALMESDDEALRDRAFLLSGDWAHLETFGATHIQPVAHFAQSPPDPESATIADDVHPLASGAALVRESEAARAAIDALLEPAP